MNTESEYSVKAAKFHKNIKTKDNNKLPKSAIALYIKLYCDRKDTKSLKHTCKMVEATKSWLTLSEFEKQKFHTKYKECQQKYSEELVKHLKKSKLFMKKKVSFRSQKNYLNDYGQPVLDDDSKETNVPLITDENHKTHVVVEENTEIFDNHAEIEKQQEEDMSCIEEDRSAPQEPSKISYPEPIAPSLKSGRELFEVIQTNGDNNFTWTSLPQRERHLYNQAILSIKRDYIQKYRQYLENLTQKELFDHYNKCFH